LTKNIENSVESVAGGTGYDETVISAIANLRQKACRDLTSVSSRLSQRSAQAAADLQRAMTTVQSDVRAAHEATAREYMDVIHGPNAAAQAAEIAQRYNQAVNDAAKAAQSKAESALEEARKAVETSIEEANAAWDMSCTEYLKAVIDRISKLDAKNPDPMALAAAGEALQWIATRVKRKEMH
jgi:hypothetical protein